MPTTQPINNLWTPGEVAMLMTVFTTVVVAGIATAIVKVIEASKNAKIAIIAATKAEAATEHNTRQMTNLQQQVTAVALNTPAAVTPVTLEQVELLRQAAAVAAAANPETPAGAGQE